MSTLIIDASVGAKWFNLEENHYESLTVLNVRNQLHAPDFFLLEMNNVFCKWIRRGLVGLADGSNLRTTLSGMAIQYHESAPLMDDAFSIANQSRRSFYDCIYLVLAIRLDGRMVTADRILYDSIAAGPLKQRVLWVGETS